MAVKTFTDNTTLPASDINTYLNNGGLVYVTGVTFSASAEINVTSAFNANFDAYQIVFSNFNSSANSQLYLRMLSGSTPLTTNNYQNQRLYAQSTSVGGTSTGAIGYGTFGYQTIGTLTGISMMVYNPFLAQNTTMFTQMPYDAGLLEMNVTRVANQVSYDGIRFYPSTGTLSGNVRIYGFRQA